MKSCLFHAGAARARSCWVGSVTFVALLETSLQTHDPYTSGGFNLFVFVLHRVSLCNPMLTDDPELEIFPF